MGLYKVGALIPNRWGEGGTQVLPKATEWEVTEPD